MDISAFVPLRGERHAFLRELRRTKCPLLKVIIMREQLNVKQSQAIVETSAKGGGGLVETASRHLAGWLTVRPSDFGSAVAFRAQY